MQGYVHDAAAYVTDRRGQTPVTVLVGQTQVNDSAPRFRDLVGENFDPAIPARFRELATEIRRVAQERGVLYADVTGVAPGDDGIHLSVESHARVAELVASTLLTGS